MAICKHTYTSCVYDYIHINEALYTCELKKISINIYTKQYMLMNGDMTFQCNIGMHACIDRYILFIHEHVTHTYMHAPIHRRCTIRGDELRWQRGGSHEISA